MPGAENAWVDGSKTFLNKGVNGRWQGIYGEADLAAYDAKVAVEFPPALAAWLEGGRFIAGDPALSADWSAATWRRSRRIRVRLGRERASSPPPGERIPARAGQARMWCGPSSPALFGSGGFYGAAAGAFFAPSFFAAGGGDVGWALRPKPIARAMADRCSL